MKVAYFMGSLNRGGAETLILDICRNTKVQDFELFVVHRKDGQLKEDFSNSGVQLNQIYPKSYFDISYFTRLRKFIIENNIRIVHAHQVIDAWFIYLAIQFLPTKVVLSFHGHGITNSVTSKILRKLILARTDLNIFVSESQLNYYVNKFGNINRILVLPNGVDFKKGKLGVETSIRKELGLNNSDLLIGTVGNFTSGRDHFTLCKFLYLLKQKNIPFKFVFVGSASKIEPIVYNKCFDFCRNEGLQNDVYFLGTRADVPNILTQLDAFTYSTEHDTFGIAVVEAMGAGLPVFVNDWEVMREITNDGAWATIYKTKNEHDLLAKFLEFLDKKDSYENEARENALSIRDKYSIESHTSNLKSIYQSLLNN